MKEHIEKKLKEIAREIERENTTVNSLEMHLKNTRDRLIGLENDKKIYGERLVEAVINEPAPDPFQNPPLDSVKKKEYFSAQDPNFVPNSIKKTLNH